MSTFQSMAPCCRPWPPMPHWSGLMGRTIHHHRHQARARVLALQSPARNGHLPRPEAERGGATRVTSAASSSATRPTAPGVIQTPCWPASPTPTRPNRATGSLSAPLGATPSAHGQPPCPDRGLPRHPSGADKNYGTKGFVAEMRRISVTPHVAQNTSRPGGSAIDGRTTRHEGYAKSIHARRGIEKV